MFSKRGLAIRCLLILVVFLITGCAPKFTTVAVLEGRVMVPEITRGKEVTGQSLANATVYIIEPITGNVVATTATDADGHYNVDVPPGGPYLVQAVKGGTKVLQVTPKVGAGKSYNLGTADANTTAVALVFQEMVKQGMSPTDIDLGDIYANPTLNAVIEAVENALIADEDPTASVDVQQAVEDSLSPTSTPTPTPVANKPAIQNTTLTTEIDGQDTILVLTLTVESNVPVSWLNATLDGPNGTIYGGGGEIFPGQGGNPSSTEVSPNVWQVVRRDRISQYAHSGDYYYTNISVRNAGMLQSEVWPGELKTTI